MPRSRALLRLVAIAGVSAVGACGHASSGPWPKSAGTVASNDWTTDGGESIEPHTASAAVVEASVDTPTDSVAVGDSYAAKPAEASVPVTPDPIEIPPEEIYIDGEDISEDE